MTPSPPPMSNAEVRMSLLAHLAELRKRLLNSTIALMVGIVASLAWVGNILDWLLAPVRAALPEKGELVYFSLVEPTYTQFYVAALAGAALSAPYVLYQIWLFIAPGLLPHERRWALPFVLAGILGAVAGCAFAYWVFFPLGFRVLIMTAGNDLKPMLSVLVYVQFIFWMPMSFAVIFQLPLALMILAKLGLVTRPQLARGRRWAILIAFGLGGFLTPSSDPLNQTLMAVPIILLYEVGLIAVGLVTGWSAAPADVIAIPAGAKLRERLEAAGDHFREQQREEPQEPEIDVMPPWEMPRSRAFLAALDAADGQKASKVSD